MIRPDRLWGWWPMAQRTVGPDSVVLSPPLLDDNRLRAEHPKAPYHRPHHMRRGSRAPVVLQSIPFSRKSSIWSRSSAVKAAKKGELWRSLVARELEETPRSVSRIGPAQGPRNLGGQDSEEPNIGLCTKDFVQRMAKNALVS